MSSRDQEGGSGADEFRYRGRTVRIERPRGRLRAAAEAGSGSRLFIDDVEVEVEETESGVLSHASAFNQYATIEELAEDLIRQRGTREVVQPGARPEAGGPEEQAAHDHEGVVERPRRRRQQR